MVCRSETRSSRCQKFDLGLVLVLKVWFRLASLDRKDKSRDKGSTGACVISSFPCLRIHVVYSIGSTQYRSHLRIHVVYSIGSTQHEALLHPDSIQAAGLYREVWRSFVTTAITGHVITRRYITIQYNKSIHNAHMVSRRAESVTDAAHFKRREGVWCLSVCPVDRQQQRTASC